MVPAGRWSRLTWLRARYILLPVSRGRLRGTASPSSPLLREVHFPLPSDPMGDQGRFRRDQDSPTQGDGGAAVRSPSSAPESSPSDLTPPSDAPTLAPEGFGPDAPTLLPISDLSPSDSPTLA